MALYLGSNKAAVTLPGGGSGGNYQTKSVTYTPTTSQQTDTITPDSGYDALEEVNVTINAMSSRIVTGTFTGTTEDAVMTVNVDYSGNGYPIGILVFVDAGIYNSNTTYYSEIKRYAIGMWSGYKNYPSVAPTYSGTGTENQVSCTSLYKSSTSSATSYTRTSSMNLGSYNTTDAIASTTACIRIKNKNTLTVYIAASGTSAQGFLMGTTYRYIVLYSE